MAQGEGSKEFFCPWAEKWLTFRVCYNLKRERLGIVRFKKSFIHQILKIFMSATMDSELC